MAEKCLVTGVAGFIGSHLAERLADEGYEVIGVDCFTDYYAREIKEANLETLRRRDNFRFLEGDLCSIDLPPLLREVDYVFHQAGQAGVRSSWGTEFAIYVHDNILAAQRLLEAAKDSLERREGSLRKFIFASSSSVYGNTTDLPTREDSLPRPYSPYGVTKLAAEHLCHLYHDNFGVPTIALRYFTVYGPRQRPDMAFHRFIRLILQGRPLPLYGDGMQTRDFTYVQDIVEANLLAMRSPVEGRSFNIGGGSRVTLKEAVALLERIIGKKAIIAWQSEQHGDARHTWADTTAAEEVLGFRPRISLEEGLTAQVNWLRKQLGM